MLGQLCSHGCDLPQPSFKARLPERSFFNFRDWHIEKMRCLLLKLESRQKERSRARANLNPFFLMLNKSLKRASYFLLEYEVDWAQVQKALTHVPADFRHICQVLFDGKSKEEDLISVASLFDELPCAGICRERDVAKLQINRMITYLQGFEPNKNYARFYKILKPSVSKIELVLDCDCKRGERLVRREISSVLATTYRSFHTCDAKCEEEKWIEHFKA